MGRKAKTHYLAVGKPFIIAFQSGEDLVWIETFGVVGDSLLPLLAKTGQALFAQHPLADCVPVPVK